MPLFRDLTTTGAVRQALGRAPKKPNALDPCCAPYRKGYLENQKMR